MDLILFLLAIVIPLIASVLIRITYSRLSKETNTAKLTGYDVARLILDKNGLRSIDIVETRGTMTDHYDPNRKVVRLSTDVYHDDSVASMAIAAHECGHAIQDDTGYILMKIRSLLVPIVNFSTRIAYIVIIIGLIANSLQIFYIGIALIVSALLFQLVTLPVEINASSRAMKQIKDLAIDNDNTSELRSMLISAAMTYVAAVLTSVLEILRLLNRINRK